MTETYLTYEQRRQEIINRSEAVKHLAKALSALCSMGDETVVDELRAVRFQLRVLLDLEQ